MKSLIANLIAEDYLTNPDIISAFRKIRREDFVLPEYKNLSYANIPLPINHGQTISQPATVAFMLELLKPQKGEKILDVGSGSGWTTAMLAEIVGPKGKVYGIERIKSLKLFGEKNVNKYNFIDNGRAKIFHGDGYDGLPKLAPFDKILISAAAENLPKKLLEQLAINGRMIIPLGQAHETQDIVVVGKMAKNKYKEDVYPGFAFVSLVKE